MVRMSCAAAQAQSRIKILEKVGGDFPAANDWNLSLDQLPDLEPPEEDETENFK